MEYQVYVFYYYTFDLFVFIVLVGGAFHNGNLFVFVCFISITITKYIKIYKTAKNHVKKYKIIKAVIKNIKSNKIRKKSLCVIYSILACIVTCRLLTH
jgi:hypothetical protein